MTQVMESALGVITDKLAAMINEDGGWGAFAGRPSNTEATALAALALARTTGRAQLAERGARWLQVTQRADGSWPFIRNDAAESWAGAMAVIALARTGMQHESVSRGARWLVATEGQVLPWRVRLSYWLNPEGQVTELDPGLNGWSWTPDAFSWVEPTAYAMLALDAAGGANLGRRARSRLDEGAAMLIDRMCYGGGWNYGSKRILGADIAPFPDTTAVALLALRGSGQPLDIDEQIALLDRLLDAHASGLALALAALCLRAYDQDDTRLRERIVSRYEDTGFLGETRSLALAAIALNTEAPNPLRRSA